MSLRINAQRNFTVIKELNYKDQSLDPEKSRSQDGNYLRIAVLNPVQITFKTGLHEYKDSDLKNAGVDENGNPETIESILKWPTIKSFIKKGILIVATGIIGSDDEEDTAPVKKTKKPITFTPDEK